MPPLPPTATTRPGAVTTSPIEATALPGRRASCHASATGEPLGATGEGEDTLWDAADDAVGLGGAGEDGTADGDAGVDGVATVVEHPARVTMTASSVLSGLANLDAGGAYTVR
jgi:hypothetical protein